MHGRDRLENERNRAHQIKGWALQGVGRLATHGGYKARRRRRWRRRQKERAADAIAMRTSITPKLQNDSGDGQQTARESRSSTHGPAPFGLPPLSAPPNPLVQSTIPPNSTALISYMDSLQKTEQGRAVVLECGSSTVRERAGHTGAHYWRYFAPAGRGPPCSAEYDPHSFPRRPAAKSWREKRGLEASNLLAPRSIPPAACQ